MNDTYDYCQFPKCTDPSDIVYMGKGLCDKHWIKIADMDIEHAYKKLGIKIIENKNTINGVSDGQQTSDADKTSS